MTSDIADAFASLRNLGPILFCLGDCGLDITPRSETDVHAEEIIHLEFLSRTAFRKFQQVLRHKERSVTL